MKPSPKPPRVFRGIHFAPPDSKTQRFLMRKPPTQVRATVLVAFPWQLISRCGFMEVDFYHWTNWAGVNPQISVHGKKDSSFLGWLTSKKSPTQKREKGSHWATGIMTPRVGSFWEEREGWEGREASGGGGPTPPAAGCRRHRWCRCLALQTTTFEQRTRGAGGEQVPSIILIMR